MSADSQHSQRMCANSMGGVGYPVLGDWHPHGKVSRQYGVWNEERGAPVRSVFIIDKDGVIRYAEEYRQGIPDPEKILAELDKVIVAGPAAR